MAHHKQTKDTVKPDADLPVVMRTGTESAGKHLAVHARQLASNRTFESYENIIDATCQAWKMLIALPDSITSTGMRDWAHVGRAQ